MLLLSTDHGEIRVKIPKAYKIELSITKLIGELTYNNGKDKVHKTLYLSKRGGTMYPLTLPKDIDGVVYASMIDSGGGGGKYRQYKSFDDIPSTILKPDEWGDLTIYIVYYDFPQDVNEITYHLTLELRKGGKIIKVDSTENLQRTTFKPKMHMD